MTNERTYQRTHPWITFNLDFSKFSQKLWLLLGESQSKCEHIAGVPLLPDVARTMYQIFLAKGISATTAIEGNTLSIEEVMERIENRLHLPPSREYLGQEIDNIVRACNTIMDEILKGLQLELTPDRIRNFNAMILKDLPIDNRITRGQIRNYDVAVGHYVGAPSQDCQLLIEKLCEWINENWDPPENYETAIGIVKAIVAHLYISWIHPFGDGNGRTARLIELQILLSLGIPSASCHLLSNHYNQTRSQYYRYLDVASSESDGIYAFIEYAMQGFVDGLREQIELIQKQQLQVHWINYIHDFFRDKKGAANSRRKHLLLDLSIMDKSIPVNEINEISNRVALEYASKSSKTIHRDVTWLEKEGLIVKTPEGIRVRSEIILALRPPKATF